MTRLLVLCVLMLLMTPLQAQHDRESGEGALSALDITALHVTRADENVLTLEIEGLAAACGNTNTLIMEWFSDVYIDFLSTPTHTIPAGDSARRMPTQRYINLSLFTVPDESACDLSIPTSVTLDLPKTVTMPDVPLYHRELSTDWDIILLVNDFAAWFYLADATDDAETTPNRGQPIGMGKTALTRWQKVDSIIEDLYSLGADPGILIPWLQGYHPDGCEAPTLVNITRSPVEPDHYSADVFRLLPIDSICPATVQPFVVSALGVVPQRNIILTFGDGSLRLKLDNTITPVQRLYATIETTHISPIEGGYSLQVSASLSENCSVPVTLPQAEVDEVTFLHIYYDVSSDLTCTDEKVTVKARITFTTLPIIVNGSVILK